MSFARTRCRGRPSCGKTPSWEQCFLVFCGSVAAGNYFVQSTVGGALSPYLIRISYRRQLILHKAPSGRCYLVFYESVAAGNYFAQSTVRGALSLCLLRVSCRRQPSCGKTPSGERVTLSFTNQLPQATIRKRQLLRKDVSFSLARRPCDGQLPLFFDKESACRKN